MLVFMFFYIFQFHKISKSQKKSRIGEIERQTKSEKISVKKSMKLADPKKKKKSMKLALVSGAYDLNFLTTLSKLDTML